MKITEDSFLNVSNAKKITEIKVSREFEAQHKIDSLEVANANIALRSETERRKNISWLFGIALLGGVFSLWQFFRTKKAQKRSDELLLNILPKTVADELKTTGKTSSKNYENISILFADIKNFTQISKKLNADQLVYILDQFFSKFDDILQKWGLEKIKTIGDAYLGVYGLPNGDPKFTYKAIMAALEMQEAIKNSKHGYEDILQGEKFEMRIGIHTGSLIAGVVGKTKIQFDIWGDAVNMAARVEAAGESGKVNISSTTFELVKENLDLKFEDRGEVAIKNANNMQMYFVSKKNDVNF